MIYQHLEHTTTPLMCTLVYIPELTPRDDIQMRQLDLEEEIVVAD